MGLSFTHAIRVMNLLTEVLTRSRAPINDNRNK